MMLRPSLNLRFPNAKAKPKAKLAPSQAKNPVHLAHKNKMVGLGAIFAGLPACAFGGFKYALPVIGFGLFSLFKARQNEKNAYAEARIRNTLNTRYVPKMSFRRPYP